MLNCLDIALLSTHYLNSIYLFKMQWMSRKDPFKCGRAISFKVHHHFSQFASTKYSSHSKPNLGDNECFWFMNYVSEAIWHFVLVHLIMMKSQYFSDKSPSNCHFLFFLQFWNTFCLLGSQSFSENFSRFQ